MIVICKKPTKRLVKGIRYEVEGLWNNGTSQRWMEGTVQIKGVGRFTVKNFVDESGNPLPQILINPPRKEIKRVDWTELKKGDILVCTSEHYKTLVCDGMYKIESLITKKIPYKSWNGTIGERLENKIKFVELSASTTFPAVCLIIV